MDINFEEMYEESKKKFALDIEQFLSSDDSDDDNIQCGPSPVMETEVEKNKAICEVNTFSNKVEGKRGKEVSFDDVYVDIQDKKTKESVKIRNMDIVNEAMKKSVIGPGFEQLESVPPYEISKNQLLKERRKKRESSTGEKWFNMPAPVLTEERKNDLKLLQMRSVLDPKRFYKKNDMKELPKFFQVGTIVESPMDFYSSRIPKKQRKQTMVDELLADADFQSYNKQRYKEIIENQRKTSYKAHRHANRLKHKDKKVKK